MSAVLREAAALMRERAEAAIHDSEGARVWHSTTPESVSAGPWEIAAGLARPDAEHIASWHPAVALAVADLLDNEASLIASVDEHAHLHMPLNGARVDLLVGIARAYLREAS